MLAGGVMLFQFLVMGGRAGGTLSGPRPELSDAQLMEIGVSSSDAVIIGRLRAVRDSMVYVPGFNRGSFVLPPRRSQWRFIDIDVREVIKGDSIESRIAVVAPDGPGLGTGGLRRASKDRNECLFFLEKRGLRWVLAWEFAPSGGVLLLRKHESAAKEARALVAAQSMENLGSEAPLIIIAEFQRKAPSWHLLFRVDNVIAGALDDQEVRVYCPIPPALSFGKAILFLRRATGPGYELLGANAGIIPITDRDGAGIRNDVERLLSEIRAASNRRTQRYE